MGWLKVDKATPDKPEVLRIAARLGMPDPDLAFAKIVRAWMWAEDIAAPVVDGSRDWIVSGATPEILDRKACQPGLAMAMQAEEWLFVEPHGLVIPNFTVFMGDKTKADSQNAKRQSDYRKRVKERNAQALLAPLLLALPDRQDRQTRQTDITNTCPPNGEREDASSDAPEAPLNHSETDLHPRPLSDGDDQTTASTRNKGAGKLSEAPSVNAEAFRAWYGVYPRKVKPAAAERAYAAAITRIVADKGITRDEARAFLLDRTIVFAGSPSGQAGKYTPHPASWLNAAQYDDDPKEWQRGDSNGSSKPTAGAGQRFSFD